MTEISHLLVFRVSAWHALAAVGEVQSRQYYRSVRENG